MLARLAPDMVLLDLAGLRASCAGELRCAAERVVAAWPAGARLQAVPEADPQLVRSGAVVRSVGAAQRRPSGALRLRIEHFGRRASEQVRRALADLRPDDRLELDLRGHRGGSVRRMLEIAALFVGPRPQALTIVGQRGAVALGIPAPARRLELAGIDVLIGPETRSSAEVLAALLHRYADARLLGKRTFGKNWAEQPLKVATGWYLMVRAGEIRIDGERLEGGLLPDGPLPDS